MKILRWIVMAPLAFLAMMLGSLLGGIALSVFGNQAVVDSGSAFFGCFALVFIAGLIAPAKRGNTMLIFAGLVTLLAIVSLVASIATSLEGFTDDRLFRRFLFLSARPLVDSTQPFCCHLSLPQAPCLSNSGRKLTHSVWSSFSLES